MEINIHYLIIFMPEILNTVFYDDDDVVVVVIFVLGRDLEFGSSERSPAPISPT